MSQALELTQTNRIASIEALDRRLRWLASWTMTTSPDVIVSTNLGAFENPLGLVA